MKTFHEIYMPTNLALKKAVHDFRQQAVDVKLIASQHGKIIRQNLINFFMARLETLAVGLDLKDASRLVTENYIKAFNDILDQVRRDIDETIVDNFLASFKSDGTFPNSLVIKNDRVYSLKVSVEEAFTLFATELCQSLSVDQKPIARTIVVNTIADWNISTDTPCPGDNEDEPQNSQQEEILEEGESSKESSEGNPLDFEKKELDSLLDDLMGK